MEWGERRRGGSHSLKMIPTPPSPLPFEDTLVYHDNTIYISQLAKANVGRVNCFGI